MQLQFMNCSWTVQFMNWVEESKAHRYWRRQAPVIVREREKEEKKKREKGGREKWRYCIKNENFQTVEIKKSLNPLSFKKAKNNFL